MARRYVPVAALTLALAAWYLTPWPALAAVWAVVYAAVAWRWPRWALALLPLTFPFWYAPLHVTRSITFPLSEAALAVVTGVTVARVSWRAWRARERRAEQRRAVETAPRGLAATKSACADWVTTRVGWLVLLGAALLAVGMTVGVVIAREPHAALRAWRWEIAEPLIFAALVVWRLRGRWVWRMVWAFIASGVMVAALAIAQTTFAHVTVAPLANGGGLIPYTDWRATAIIYGSPNSAGAWIMRALALLLGCLPWIVKQGRIRGLPYIGIILLLIVGLSLTGSRGAELGAFVAFLVCVVAVWLALRARSASPTFLTLVGEGGAAAPDEVAPRRRYMALGVATLIIALVYGSSALWLSPLVRVIELLKPQISNEVRLYVWQSGLAMAKDHPLLGVGPDQFLYYYDPQYTNHPYLIATQNGHPTAAASEANLSHPHNTGLELWLSAGLLGLFGFMLALVATLTRGWAALGKGLFAPSSNPGQVSLIIGLMAALLATLTHGLVDSAYFQPDFALAFWGMVAVMRVATIPPHARANAT